MVKKAKTVGQLLGAFVKAIEEAAPGTEVAITFEDGEYTVAAGDFVATGPKLYDTITRVSKDFLGAPPTNSARERLRARLGVVSQ